MSHFLQLHLLTCYPPANLNRDDLGRPKTCTVGGVERLRVSSQSLKRAWRTSTLFRETVTDPCGVRTKRMGVLMFRALAEGRTLVDQVAIEEAGTANPPDGTLRRLAENQAVEVTKQVAAVFGKLSGAGGEPDEQVDAAEAAQPPESSSDEAVAAEAGQRPENDGEDAEEESPECETPVSDLELKQLAHFSREEIRAVSELLETIRAGGNVPSETELKRQLLCTGHSAADIAMFGRFFADKREFTVEAAVQVAHAFGVQRATISDDFFTAVDDLNRRDLSGAGHMDV